MDLKQSLEPQNLDLLLTEQQNILSKDQVKEMMKYDIQAFYKNPHDFD